MANLAKSIALTAVIILSSCGSNDKTISQKAGEAIGESVTEFGKGVGTKIDESANIKLELEQAIIDLGISHTVAKTNTFETSSNKENKRQKAVIVYLLSKNEVVEKQYKLMAFDQNGVEIGRSKASISFTKDDAKFVDFTFDDRTDFALVKTYRLSQIQ